MAMRKGKFMPLSEADVSPSRVAAYDGQSVRVAGASDARLVMGNYLGGGIAGVVYEAYDARARRHVAVKILNPVGYKLAPPAALRRGQVVRRGVPVVGHVRGMTLDNVYWVRLAHKRDLVACYALSASAPAGAGLSASTCMPAMAPPANNSAGPVLRELTLEMCVSLWLLDHDDDELLDEDDRGADGLAPSNTTASAGRRRPRRPVEDPVLDCFDRRAPSDEQKTDDADELMLAAQGDDRPDAADEPPVPRMPAKFRSFLRARKTIFREIAHMHKLTGNSVSGDQIGGGHENVLKLYDVLELVQPSKSTIFLVLELAYGGELFDRIRSDQGVEESVARGYVAQLLAGVLYCHQLGIVHRDLKPENLLLSETDVLKIADFGLSAHFIAAVSNGHDAGDDDDENNDQCMLDNDVGSRLLAPPGARFRRLNSIVGSPHYVAPEVLQNARYGYDGRKADMWSIGVIIYGLLVGNLPFGKDLATCPRYLKFCEWVRALPSDPHSGKLLFQPELFQPGSVRLVSSSSSSSSSTAASPSSESSQPPLHPGFQPMLGMSSMLWTTNGQSNASVPPVAPPSVARMRSSNTNVSSNGNNCMNGAAETTSVLVTNGAVGRRGSRIVSFPSWFFPARLSPSAVFLIASLLHPDPARRFSCEDACKAAWVVDATR